MFNLKTASRDGEENEGEEKGGKREGEGIDKKGKGLGCPPPTPCQPLLSPPNPSLREEHTRSPARAVSGRELREKVN